jgi:tripartite ATP-independent transporter DctM subunit
MDQLSIGLLGFAIFIALSLLRVPIAYGMAIVGLGGMLIVYPIDAAFKFIPTGLFTYTSNFTLSALPLFILMGTLAFYADLGKDAYDAAKAWFGRVPGGLGVATVYSSAIFGACSGSSLSAVAVFSKIAVPEMVRAGYNKKMALGVVASAGCLDVLIPPSILMVFYGILTETSVGQLLIAGIMPGILTAVLMATSVMIFCKLFPDTAPISLQLDTSWQAKWQTLKRLWAAAALFISVLGAIYTGFATPDEAAAVGVVGSLLLVYLRGNLTWERVTYSFIDSAKVSAMIFLLLGAGYIFSTFLSTTGVVSTMTGWIKSLDLGFFALMFGIVLLYLFLGCFLDAISMMVLTMPVLAPLMADFDMSLVWFGVVVVVMMAIGTITPPLGLNCFVMKGALGQAFELKDIFAGSLPFVVLMLITVALLVVFPEISLWLPEMMKAMR